MTEKKFYYFRYRKKPTILYDSRNIFKTKIFSSLSDKITLNRYKKAIRKNMLISKIFESFYSTYFTVPENNIRIIYIGYGPDNKMLLFKLNKNNDVECIYENDINKKTFKKMGFLGYPINIYRDITFHKKIYETKLKINERMLSKTIRFNKINKVYVND